MKGFEFVPTFARLLFKDLRSFSKPLIIMIKSFLLFTLAFSLNFVYSQDESIECCCNRGDKKIVLGAHNGVRFYYVTYPARKQVGNIYSWAVFVYVENTNDFDVKVIGNRYNQITIGGLFGTDYPLETTKKFTITLNEITANSIYTEFFYLKSNDAPIVALNSLSIGRYEKVD